MPNVYNVSAITNILSGIIQESLQDVSVRGRVSLDRARPNVFFLSHAGKQIRCFISDGGIALFDALLQAGHTVTVIGNIQIFPIFSQYQISVKDVRPFGINGASTVSEITQQLSGIIKETPELLEIQVQGKISGLASHPGATSWDFRDVGNQRIRCFFNNAVPADDGDEVRIQGKIEIYGARSQYQIRIQQIEHNEALCQCPGCDRCQNAPPCDRLREVANFEARVRPSDELYALCPQCYENSPDHETKVADEVYAYFDKLQVNGFSPDKERCIQFGARNGIADVVLADGNGSFAAIAECKGAGYVGHGIEQLKSYLSATDTRFGVFANKADPNEWKFYENRRGNCISEIDCSESEFKAQVVEWIANRERLRDEIANLNGEITGLENKKSELIAAVEQITQTKHNLTERTSNLTQQIETLQNYKSELHKEIHRKLDNLLEEKMKRLERPLSDLKIELQKRGIINWLKNLFSKENK